VAEKCFHDGRREAFEAGDVMFVAAGTEHRFEDFTDDLAIWLFSTALLVARFQPRAPHEAR
jgi:hypothetical protein